PSAPDDEGPAERTRPGGPHCRSHRHAPRRDGSARNRRHDSQRLPPLPCAGARTGDHGVTQAPAKPLYGPVSEDMILVEDLLESIKQVELAPLRRMLDHALEARGKRLRPALVLLTGNLGDYNLNKLVPLGAAIELLHTASLVHDDVVDGAMSRRGRPTANAVFDNAITVL